MEAYAAAGLTREALEARLDVWPSSSGAKVVHRRLLPRSDPFERLARLFVLGESLTEHEAREVFGSEATDELVAGGILVSDPVGLAATCSVAPYAERLFMSDRRTGEPLPAELVTGVSPSAVSAANFTPRRHVRSALDLGTGFGIHALLAATHSDTVLGTDIDERALGFAAN